MIAADRTHIVKHLAFATLAVLSHGWLPAQSVPTVAPASAPAAPVAPELLVLRQDNRGIVFEYRPRLVDRRIDLEGGRSYLLVDFEASSWAEFAEGNPDVRFRAVPVAFPSQGGNTVRVLAAEYQDRSSIDFAPRPKIRDREGIPVADEYRQDPEAYSRPAFFPAQVADLVAPGRVRTVYVGSVRVYPIQYNPATRTLRQYSRIVIEVTFGSGPAGASPSTDDPLVREAVVNAEALRSWRAPVATSRAAAPTPSVLASGEWYRIAVNAEGIYKLDAKFFSSAGVNIAGVDPRTIKIYGNGGTELPEDLTLPRISDLAQNAIYVQGEADGKFDDGDYVLFYGRGPSGWTYDPRSRTFAHRLHHYADENYYWLTFGGTQGKRMSSVPSNTGSPALVAQTFTDHLFVEEEKVNLLRSGKNWYGQSIAGPAGSFTYMNKLTDAVPNAPIVYRYNLVAHADQPPAYTVKEGSYVLGVHSLSATYGYLYASSGTFLTSGSFTLDNNESRLGFTFNAVNAAAQGWIDWIEIQYPRYLWASGEYLRFRSPDMTGIVEYQLQKFSGQPMIFDVTVQDDVKLLSGVISNYVFRRAEAGGQISEYCAAGASSWGTPLRVQKMQNQDLHGTTGGADFIIITAAEHRAAADRLKAFREQPAHGGLKTTVVEVDKIYNEFSGGQADVTAIRDFLRYTYDNWTPRPGFVLLIGQGSYDYKAILGTKSSTIPTWQTDESHDEIYSYCSDDYFVKFGQTDQPWMVVGRISGRTVAEVNTVVDKIIRYDESSISDTWKMRTLFVGDDAWTSEGGERGDGTMHSDDAETLSSSAYTPDEFEKRKIYIAEYPTVNSAEGRRKPTAFQAIIDQINQGVLIFNYSGHGRADLLAHEHIFEVQTSVPQLTNANKLAVFFLATCGFSEFDDPKAYTGSEILMNKPDGAAVGVVSATRKVYAGANAQLNQGTYRRMFLRDASGRVVIERPATALYQFKISGGNNENDQKFGYMGDPTMRLQFPSIYATIDTINQEPVDSTGGVPRTDPVLVQSLSKVTVSGTVRGTDNRPDPNYNGRVTLLMNDATQMRVIINFYPGVNWQYLATGGTIYRGDNSVNGGRFRATFVVPKDVAYADPSSRGRLVAYLTGGSGDGGAYTGNFRIGGTDSTVRNDGKGPDIQLYLNSRSFRSGDLISPNPVLLADLRDSSGINTSGSGIGHRIEAWINNGTQSKDLTEYYKSTLDNYREGTVQYELKDLPQGRNMLRVRAWDSYNNSSVTETFFTVSSGEGLAISDVLNYPNPFSSNTLFTFRQNQGASLDVTIKVFTVAGRLIRSIDWITSGEPYVSIPWDGRDQDGDLLANGVYLYKVVARTVDGQYSTEALGKLSIIK
jgi:hypothetical protein